MMTDIDEVGFFYNFTFDAGSIVLKEVITVTSEFTSLIQIQNFTFLNTYYLSIF